MNTVKTLLVVGLCLLAVAVVGSGPVVAADQKPTASAQVFTFHYGPFGPGQKLMGSVPKQGFAFLDKAEGAVQKPDSLNRHWEDSRGVKP